MNRGNEMFKFSESPKILPPLDHHFKPAILAHQGFLNAVKKSKNPEDVIIAVKRENGLISTFKTQIFHESERLESSNIYFLERLIKSLLWIKGGYEISFSGPRYLGDFIKSAYHTTGMRAFDEAFMRRVYEQPFKVNLVSYENAPLANEKSKPLGRNLKGYRIGFDAGGSDRKVSAVVDGIPIYSEEVIWNPKLESDPKYHYEGILSSMKTAASKMPQVDAIGVSSAGIYIDNKIKAASLFIKVNETDFDQHVKHMYLDIAKALGDIPIEVANDGDVTALAGAMSLNENKVLGIAMGTSEAAGYVDEKGHITGWLNELAFVPVDYHPLAARDDWSNDIGCGVQYFSQDAVIRLASQAKIDLDATKSPAEKLSYVQSLVEKDDPRAKDIFATIGVYLGYTIPYYALFYDIKEILILGRVTSGKGGNIILNEAQRVLKHVFPKLAKQVRISLPDEKNKRVGQSIAAASLVNLDKGASHEL